MPPIQPITRYYLTEHAQLEMARRQISESEVARVLASPEQSIWVRPGRIVFQSRIQTTESHKAHLLRVFVDIDRIPAEVVTVYRTTKLEKYWSISL